MANFISSNEYELQAGFLKRAYCVQNVENQQALDQIRDRVVEITCEHLGLAKPQDPKSFLDRIAEQIAPDKLNALKVKVMNTLIDTPWFRQAYYITAAGLLQSIIGNELAMQRNMGFSIQLPNDDHSLLPLHSDIWGSECSPFEAVLWLPLVDCYKTKSVFFLNPEADRKWRQKLNEFSDSEQLYKAIEPEVDWLTVNYGQVALFSPTVMHGNRVNRESTARWSFNVRFKGLFTPYANKRLGEYFLPITTRPLSKIGMSFDFPGGFGE